MSKYTTEVRYICENAAGLEDSKGFASVKDILFKAAPVVFDFDFPIFDELYRRPLEMKILRHYYTREICEETAGLWKLRLEDRMNIIMPYFNKLYEAELVKFNPLYDVDLTRDHVTKNQGESTSNETGKTDVNGKTTEDTSNTTTTDSSANGTTTKKADNWQYYSDTPQGAVSDLASHTYLTNATNNTADETNTSTETGKSTVTDSGGSTGTNTQTTNYTGTGKNTITNTEDYLEHVKGKQGTQSYTSLLVEYRDSFINIDKMIIEELSDLFFRLW